jgi:hypothetical protein
MAVTKEEIAARAASVAFGKPLVMNVLRAIIIETIVDAALGAGWKWCSGDYNGWDFEHTDRTRLEVKQSAALQSWPTTKESAAIFDIAPRAGYWVDGIRWVKETARHAHIYVFARHPVTDIARADHRDPSQWDFYVVPSSKLPSSTLLRKSQRTIRLASIIPLSSAKCNFGELDAVIEEARARLRPQMQF